jgi:hypothetical protein
MKSNTYQNKINKHKSEGLSYGGREKWYNLVDLKRATLWKSRFFLIQCHHVLMDFVVFPPGHGSSVTDF